MRYCISGVQLNGTIIHKSLREDDFCQGAAAGALGSFGGSFSGAAGITDFAGIVGVSTVMGGVGSVIAGARSPEEILFGMATGAVVGALNFGEHEIEEKKNQIIAKKSQTIVSYPNIEVERYITGISQEGDPTTTEVIDWQTREPIEIQTKLGTIGVDGSYTVSNGSIRIGTDGRNYIMDVSIPTGVGTTGGFTLKLNSRVVNTIIYYTAPFFVPVLRPVWRYVPIR